MNIVASNAHFRQRVIKKSYKVGVTAASKYYRISRNAIYEWRKKYDGNWKSLIDKSHRPAHHPNEHTQAEKEMILRRYPRYKDDMIMLWGSLRKSGYTRSYTSLVRVVNKWIKPEIKKKAAKNWKPYKKADYPGQKVQVDVKFVPSYCVVSGQKYYQYTAVDECTRWTFREMYDEHSTYSSRDFLLKLIAAAPFQIREIQTDNGSEFTNANVDRPDAPLTSFELLLQKMDIIYHRIKIATPRHNGKVERQHRTDEQRFYKKMKMYNLEDGRKQLAKYNKKSNDIPKICLEFKTPNEVMAEYLGIM
ncbi:DDE-type integrase/transposase/recombinase [Acetivibrio sp. MSJd-27]|uniref:DDE-type integrase/transposase/recombinase n=1 Tax=Acetivibrio sp. MSJd-27 TaxID=2841523 RepID=UPI001C102E7F|nr:DDE-type integrase/transposase/recombinase [Acetivibrio sp. MSJd-27]MBU5449476.1 DDE-type integrase/transposase/recombinase [Acetivibrio sp. MSJd-27]